MTRTIYLYLILLFNFFNLTAQQQKSIDHTLQLLNNNSVPYISVQELNEELLKGEVLIFDTRKKEEYQVSRIKNAKFIGEKLNAESLSLDALDKNHPIVVYCSIGVRSEDLGEVLLKKGFTNVKNLYGGIFLWKNRGFEVFNQLDRPTENIHAYNRFWGRLLKSGNKIY